MKKVDRWVMAESAAKRWFRQYAGSHLWEGRSKAIYHRLEALGPNPPPDDVDAVIGNNSWTQISTCDQCGGDAQELAVLDTSDPHEWAVICPRCSLKLLMMLEP